MKKKIIKIIKKTGQLSNVGSKVLEDFLAALTKLDVGRERGLPPDTITKVLLGTKMIKYKEWHVYILRFTMN